MVIGVCEAYEQSYSSSLKWWLTHIHPHIHTYSISTYRLGPSGRMGRVKMIQKKYLHFFMIILSKIDIWPHFCFKIPNRYFLIHESLRSQDTCFRILNTFGNVRNWRIQYHLFEGFSGKPSITYMLLNTKTKAFPQIALASSPNAPIWKGLRCKFHNNFQRSRQIWSVFTDVGVTAE